MKSWALEKKNFAEIGKKMVKIGKGEGKVVGELMFVNPYKENYMH